jgi:hypothetical protein
MLIRVDLIVENRFEQIPKAEFRPKDVVKVDIGVGALKIKVQW